jgi:hypothetical protein
MCLGEIDMSKRDDRVAGYGDSGMGACGQPWPSAARRAKAASQFSACGPETAPISSATTQQHLVWFVSPVRVDCRMAGRTLRQRRRRGRWLLSGWNRLRCRSRKSALLVAIDPGQLALAAAEDSALEARLGERLSGSIKLFDLARALAVESAAGCERAALWNEVAGASLTVWSLTHFRVGVGNEHVGQRRALRLKYVDAHLDEPSDRRARE